MEERTVGTTFGIIILIILLYCSTSHVKAAASSSPKVYMAEDDAELKKLTESFFSLWKVPEIPLDLSTLDEFEGRRCIMVITNFLNSDLAGIRQPIVIRKLALTVIHDEEIEYTNYYTHLVWAKEGRGAKRSEEAVINSCLLYNQTGSRLDYEYPVRCSQLDFNQLTAHSKPWNCEITLSILPSSSEYSQQRKASKGFKASQRFPGLRSHYLFPPVWHYQWIDDPRELSYRQITLPSEVSAIHAFLVPSVPWENSFTDEKRRLLVSDWMTDMLLSIVNSGSEKKASLNCVFLLIHMKQGQSGNFEMALISYIANLPSYDPQVISISSVKETAGLQHVAESSWQRKWPWHFTEDGDTMYWGRNFPHCEDFTYASSTRLHLKDHHSYVDLFTSHLLSHFWTSLFSNYSVGSENAGLFCENGRVKTEYSQSEPAEFATSVYTSQVPSSSLHFPFRFSVSAGNLQLVACGSMSEEPMPFRELVNVYELPVWLFLGTIVLVTAGAHSQMAYLSGWSKRSVTLPRRRTQMYAMMKVLLEQGDPFPSSVFKESWGRIVFASFLLMGIILSNGYKNKNVYNMVLPPKSILYETFEQLVENKVQIYTEVVYTLVSNRILEVNETQLKKYIFVEQNHIVNFQTDPNSKPLFHAYSAVFARSRNFTEGNDAWSRDELNDNKIAGKLRNNTSVLPQAELLLGVLRWAKAKRLNNSRDRKLKLIIKYHELQEKRLKNLLENCEEKPIALLVTGDLAVDLVRETKGKSGGSYFGKESYMKLTYRAHLGGIVPPNFISKLRRWKESGIAEKWDALLRAIYLSEIYYRSTERDSESSSSVQKDFIVIYVIFAADILFAVLWFVGEMTNRHFLNGILFFTNPTLQLPLEDGTDTCIMSVSLELDESRPSKKLIASGSTFLIHSPASRKAGDCNIIDLDMDLELD